MHHSIPGTLLSGATVAPTSHVRASVILILRNAGILTTWGWCNLKWYEVQDILRKNLLFGTTLKVRRVHTDIMAI